MAPSFRRVVTISASITAVIRLAVIRQETELRRPAMLLQLNIADNAGIALFKTSNSANFTARESTRCGRLDQPKQYELQEGAGYPALVPFSIDYSFVRKIPSRAAGAVTQDTNDNAADFLFVDTNGTSAGAGQRLGAPGPENMSAPRTSEQTSVIRYSIRRKPKLIRQMCSRFHSDPANNSTFGTLSIRRKFTNNTGGNITRLRFRIIDLTTFPSPIRYFRSETTHVRHDRRSTDRRRQHNVAGTTLEQPPSQPNGGGFNSSMSVPSFDRGAAAERRECQRAIPDGSTANRLLPICRDRGVDTGWRQQRFLITGDTGRRHWNSCATSDTNAHADTNTNSVANADSVTNSDTHAWWNHADHQRVSLAWSKRRERRVRRDLQQQRHGYERRRYLTALRVTLSQLGRITRFIIPNGTIIPARGHYLAVNNVGYSLAAIRREARTTAVGDDDVHDKHSGQCRHRVVPHSQSSKLQSRKPLDAVGPTSEANALYREGAGLRR